MRDDRSLHIIALRSMPKIAKLITSKFSLSLYKLFIRVDKLNIVTKVTFCQKMVLVCVRFICLNNKLNLQTTYKVIWNYSVRFLY